MMFCSQCGMKVPDDSAFCHECGAAMAQEVQAGPPQAGQPIAGASQFRLHPAMIGSAAAALAGVVVLIVFLAGPFGGGGGIGSGSDEDQVRALLKRSVSLWEDRDWRGMYDLMSPTDRETCSFEEFLELAALVFAFTGGEDIEPRDTSVTVEGHRAYASYDVYVGGNFFVHEEADVFVKENGRWYDEDEDNVC